MIKLMVFNSAACNTRVTPLVIVNLLRDSGRPASRPCRAVQHPEPVGPSSIQTLWGRPASRPCGAVQHPDPVGPSSIQTLWGRPASRPCRAVQHPDPVGPSSIQTLSGRPASRPCGAVHHPDPVGPSSIQTLWGRWRRFGGGMFSGTSAAQTGLCSPSDVRWLLLTKRRSYDFSMEI